MNFGFGHRQKKEQTNEWTTVVVKYLSRLKILSCQAIVLANSDCPMEDQAGLEHLRESLLSSLHDAVNYIRFFINIDDKYF